MVPAIDLGRGRLSLGRRADMANGMSARVSDDESSDSRTLAHLLGVVVSPGLVPTGAALAALRLSEEARGLRGLDVLRRSVDRAPPAAG